MKSENEIETIIAAVDDPIQGSDKLKEEERKWRTPGFQRMRLDWKSADRTILDKAKSVTEGRLLREFPEAYRMMNRIYDVVRNKMVDPLTGEILLDQWQLPRWEVDSLGGYKEDFTRLGIKEKEDFLFSITTHLFEWQQLAADAWGEAMFAKAQWEERFSIGFDAPMSGTLGDREAAGRLDARDERYFALLMSLYSRKADSLIRSLELIGQRIKDSI